VKPRRGRRGTNRGRGPAPRCTHTETCCDECRALAAETTEETQ